LSHLNDVCNDYKKYTKRMIFQDIAWLEDAGREEIEQQLPAKAEPRSRLQGSRRSALMVSAHRIKHLNKLDELTADIAVLNLEDGVAPEEKPRARALAALFVANARNARSELVVRVNPMGEGGEEDIDLINRSMPDAIRIPKLRTPQEVERACGLIDPAIQIHISIETGEALRNLPELRVEERVDTAYLGVLDLCADLGLPQSVMAVDNPTAHHLLSRFLVDARIAGLHPVSFVFQEYQDLDTFEKWCQLERFMGFTSKGCISPGQVEVANRIFAPHPEEIERARAIVQCFEEEAAKGSTGFVHEQYGFIDEPIYRGAIGLLATLE
jgi:citrate lyase subunit beta/citryl-CoA lyase